MIIMIFVLEMLEGKIFRRKDVLSSDTALPPKLNLVRVDVTGGYNK